MKTINGIIAVIKHDSKTAHRCAKQLKLDKLLEYFISDINIHRLQNLFITNDYLKRSINERNKISCLG